MTSSTLTPIPSWESLKTHAADICFDKGLGVGFFSFSFEDPHAPGVELHATPSFFRSELERSLVNGRIGFCEEGPMLLQTHHCEGLSWLLFGYHGCLFHPFVQKFKKPSGLICDVHSYDSLITILFHNMYTRIVALKPQWLFIPCDFSYLTTYLKVASDFFGFPHEVTNVKEDFVFYLKKYNQFDIFLEEDGAYSQA